jgi:flagellar biosynthesis/type III secretory pathway protein FliH
MHPYLFSTTLFATVVMVHLKSQETRGDSQQRKIWKFNLTRRLYERGYQRQDVLNLYRFIDWLMQLPEDLELEFRRDLEQLEEGKMPYISSIERMARQEGKQEGRQEEVESLLETKFGALDEELRQILNALMQLPASERARLILQLSREDLIAHFQQPN